MAPRRPANMPKPEAQHITGPTSAMTSFLREQGITGPGATRRPDDMRRTPSNTATPVVVEENEEEVESETMNLDPTNTNAIASGSGSSPIPKKRKSSGKEPSTKEDSPALKKLKLKEKAAAEKKKLEKNMPKGKPDPREPGSICKCGECGKKFTVTKYTVPNTLAAGGLLCSPCTTDLLKSSSANQKSAPKPKAKAAPKKRVVKSVVEKEVRIITTLQQYCINVIGNHIADVEALGDIGSANLDRIAKIVCKHRALTAENIGLFLDIAHRELTLYDCTNIKDTELSSIAMFCPHLERLSLNMCGRLDDDVLEVWGKGFKELKYLTLYAPYLVTFTQWIKYFSTFNESHALDGFGITQSPRFNDDCIRMLVERNPRLYNLQLSELGKLNDFSLSLLYPLKYLTTLDISRAGLQQGLALTDEGVVALLENVGENLIDLNLDQNYLLTDRVLLEGIKVHCPRLRSLSLSCLAEIQSTGVQSLFTDWVNSGLTHLNLHRCTRIENEALSAIISHSGSSLIRLNLHSVDELESATIISAIQNLPQVIELDLSFCREVDNFVMKEIMNSMMSLRKLFVHGCNNVDNNFKGRKEVSIRGIENYAHIEL